MQMMRTMTAAHKHCPKAITGILVSIAALLSVVILLDKAIMTKEETFEYVIGYISDELGTAHRLLKSK